MRSSRLKKFLKSVGPGFITGAADDDPSGIATYAQTGAQFGYTQLWFALFVTPFMVVVQEICGRIGMVTGKGLSSIIRMHYSKLLLYAVVSLLFLANTINIGADLGAMAASATLVTGLPRWLWLIGFTVLIVLLEIFVTYRIYAKFLKYLAFSLLVYVLAAFTITQPWMTILAATLIPSFSFAPEYIVNIVALFGTTISPYLFFWQTDEEVEEEVAHHAISDMGCGIPRVTRKGLRSMRLDTAMGMIFSNIITFFIITTSASTLGAHGVRTVATAAEAAAMLQPLAGRAASLLFALGVIGIGLLAVPILAGAASYAVAEAFGWHEGLFRTFKQAPGFYGVIVLATCFGLVVSVLKFPAFEMLYYAAVLNGVIAPPLLVLILLIARNRRIMGTHTTPMFSNILGWIVTAVMAIAAFVLVVHLYQGAL
ncbi:MAG: divalent metal cation transporter [Candidatus Peribacteraceae bacterium]|nr:divalent metal cation transporter [Candidatus Peribacteraceae bacterium]